MIALSPTPVLMTDRFVLRAPAARDFAAWRDFILSDRGAILRTEPFGLPEAWAKFATILGHWVLRGYGLFIITGHDNDRALGLVGPWCPEGRPEPEIAWSCWDATREGTGMMAETARAARSFAFETLGWTTAVSYILPENTRSAALARRLGAQLDATAAQPAQPCDVYRHPNPERAAA